MEVIKILLVDDRDENLTALEALLRREGVELLLAQSGNDALRMAWEHDIAIALVDVQMPEMDGFELVKILKSNPRTQDMLVIFVTAISKESRYAIRAFSEGAVDYLFKPLDPYLTSAKVESFIQLARAQRELKKRNRELEIFSIVVNNSADIICEIDPYSFKIQRVNPAVTNLLGYSQGELPGTSFLDLLDPEDGEKVAKKSFEKLVMGETAATSFETRFRTVRHEWLWMEARVNYYNKVLFMNISDISARKSLQDDLVRSRELAIQAKKIKENFLASMSHEIRTPISGIIGLTNLLKDTPLTDEQAGMLSLIESSSNGLMGVINDVLDLSKIEAGQFKIVRSETNLRYLLNSLISLMQFRADEKSLRLILEAGEDLPELIFCDSLRLNQILMNLLGNALKFTEVGHVRLQVGVKEREPGKVLLSFVVEDTGIGIAPEQLNSIFDSYVQAGADTAHRFGGTGLGLAIVKKLAELKGGKITISSQQGKGSRFTFTNWYTVIEKKKEEKVTLTMADLKPFEDLTVLLAEDNLINQYIATQLFERWNASIHIAENGLKALEMLQKGSYDIVLMDTQMPVLDGYSTARKIREDLPAGKRDIPIISLSAAVLSSEQEAALEAGMNEVVGKPFDPVDLYFKVKKLTGK